MILNLIHVKFRNPSRHEVEAWDVAIDHDAANVRFGSKSDIGACPSNVRFAPESGHQKFVAALQRSRDTPRLGR